MSESKIIVGCMSWGRWGKNLSIKEQADLIHFNLAQNNSTFDHADIYGDHTTEAQFGKALETSGIQREHIQLISKCGIMMQGTRRENKVKHYNYSKEYIIESAEQSLKSLKTDYLDTFLLHRPSPLMQAEEIAAAIDVLIQEGKILKFGVSNFLDSQIELLSQHIQVNSNQIEFSLTQRYHMDAGTLDKMQIRNIEVMAWSPLGSFFKEDKQYPLLKATLDELTRKYNCEPDTLLYAWILKHPAKISPVIGTTNPERIKNAHHALSLKLDLEDWFQLLEAAVGKEVP